MSLLFRQSIFLISIAFIFGSSEVNEYFDRIFKIHLPAEFAKENVTNISLPSFAYRFQNRSSDGQIINAQIYYTFGNLSGLNISRKGNCGDLHWDFSNKTANCTFLMPQMQANFIGAIFYSGFNLRVKVPVQANFSQAEGQVAITQFPTRPPMLKHLKLVSLGDISVHYFGIEKLHYQMLVVNFQEKVRKVIKNAFNSLFPEFFKKIIAQEHFPIDY